MSIESFNSAGDSRFRALKLIEAPLKVSKVTSKSTGKPHHKVPMDEKSKANAANTNAMEPLDNHAVQDIVGQLKQFIQNTERDLKFEINESTGQILVQVVDPETKEVIRQIPPNELVEIAERFGKKGYGEGFFVNNTG